MGNKVKLKLGNKDVLGEVIRVNHANEAWNEYLLEDGSVLKLKTVITDVFRVENEYDPEGNPIYYVKSSNVMSVNAQDDIKKK